MCCSVPHERIISSGSNPNSRQSAAATPEPTPKASRTSAHRYCPCLVRYLLGPFRFRMALRIRSRSSISHPLNFITSESSGCFPNAPGRPGASVKNSVLHHAHRPIISLAKSHISCPVFFLAGLRGFAYSHLVSTAAIQRLHGRRFSFFRPR